MARKLEPIIHKCHAYPKKLKKVERQGFLSSAAYKVQAYIMRQLVLWVQDA